MNGFDGKWTKPSVIKTYKYREYMIEHRVQHFVNSYSCTPSFEFVGLKDGKVIVENCHSYTECKKKLNGIMV